VRVRPEHGAADAVDRLHQVVVVVPVDREEDEAERIVISTAITPSLNASSLLRLTSGG